MLNINNLFYFFKTVECGSYAAAAKELYLTPQAVSNGVSSLEQELGLELVNKNRPKATPTPTGLTIFEHSLDIFESISNLEATAKLTREANPSIIKGHLRVAISSFLAEGVLSNPFWHDFQRQYTMSLCRSFRPEATGVSSLLNKGKRTFASYWGQSMEYARRRIISSPSTYSPSPVQAIP